MKHLVVVVVVVVVVLVVILVVPLAIRARHFHGQSMLWQYLSPLSSLVPFLWRLYIPGPKTHAARAWSCTFVQILLPPFQTASLHHGKLVAFDPHAFHVVHRVADAFRLSMVVVGVGDVVLVVVVVRCGITRHRRNRRNRRRRRGGNEQWQRTVATNSGNEQCPK